MLPSRRMELYLAQIAYLIAVCCGHVKNKSMSDYLFDPEPYSEPKDEVESAAEFFGFAPIQKPKPPPEAEQK